MEMRTDGGNGVVRSDGGAGAGLSADTGRTYLCIDLKCFYASVECAARGLDPFEARLAVADKRRGDSTICLAISPALKELGVRNRCRLFEIPPSIDYLAAPPRMQLYMEVSAEIYAIYLRYIAPEDIHVYSIDECFIDATPYLSLYGVTARELAVMLMRAVRAETGICATAGVGTNLFLAKVALDITAKHIDARSDSPVGELDDAGFKRTIWPHRPITDIWNIGPGIAARLEKYGVRDLLGVAFMDEEVLYREFGANAEFLIDHAWGREPCTIKQIKEYEPQARSLCNGQILGGEYSYDEALVVLKEMVDASVLELVEKRLVTGHISLMVGYARDKGGEAGRAPVFVGEHGTRPAWRRMGEHTGGSRKIPERTNSYRKLMPHFERLFSETTLRDRPIRRINVGLEGLVGEEFATVDLFTDAELDAREHQLQETVLAVKDRFGKNALIKGVSLGEKATARERNMLIGGHRAGYGDDPLDGEGEDEKEPEGGAPDKRADRIGTGGRRP